MTLDTVIFYFSAFVAVAGAAMMITLRNPVLSVMSLIVSFVAQAVLYVQLAALFIGAVLIIVYSGAIMVLFLFVIMLLNLRGNEDLGDNSPVFNRIIKYTLSFALLVELVFAIRSGIKIAGIKTGILPEASATFGSVEEVAKLLFTKYLYPFELTSILLLAAIVGAVVMAKRGSGDPEADAMPMETVEPAADRSNEGEL